LKIKIPSFLLKGKVFLKNLYERKAVVNSSIRSIPEYWVCDGSKAEKELGFHTHTPLAEGVIKTAIWYSREGLI